jgi:uncharacterized membrane protein YgdD (TMEM256/DUF423 family)
MQFMPELTYCQLRFLCFLMLNQSTNPSWPVRVSAALAMLGVALGAFGAHGLKEVLAASANGVEVWKTAVFYHLLHAVVMYVVALHRGSMRAWWLFAAGVVCFSGSLYLLSTMGWKWLGPGTPLGGVFFIAGWATLMLRKPEAV